MVIEKNTDQYSMTIQAFSRDEFMTIFSALKSYIDCGKNALRCDRDEYKLSASERRESKRILKIAESAVETVMRIMASIGVNYDELKEILENE